MKPKLYKKLGLPSIPKGKKVSGKVSNPLGDEPNFHACLTRSHFLTLLCTNSSSSPATIIP